ncbi:MAG: hypothetical protein HY392_05490 [Candidatus Diapherotrites archaeon]|nr:hypothetical protein [Candidatus Diapherotrites archaeon]
MQVPKIVFASIIFAVVLVSAGFFAGQLANPAIAQEQNIAQRQKITDTVVLFDKSLPADDLPPSGGIIALPGASCKVFLYQCGPRLARENEISMKLVPALYKSRNIQRNENEQRRWDSYKFNTPAFTEYVPISQPTGITRYSGPSPCHGSQYNSVPAGLYLVGQVLILASEDGFYLEFPPADNPESHYDSGMASSSSLTVSYECT